MPTMTLHIPMNTSPGMQNSPQASRDFRGSLPTVGAVAVVANIVREGLETAQYPGYAQHVNLSDEYLVQEVALVLAVPNDVWIRNGFFPLSEWSENG